MHRANAAQFSARETHGFVELESCTVITTSAGLGWSKSFMSLQEEAPYKRSFKAIPDILLGIINAGSFRARFGARDRIHNAKGAPGSIGIVPDQTAFDAELLSKVRSTHLYIRRSVFDDVSQDIYQGDPAGIEIMLRLAIYDPVLEQLCKAIQEVLDDISPTSALYVEHMTHAVSAHILRHYSTVGRQRRMADGKGKLSSREIGRISEVIEAKLGERLTLADLVSGTGMGPDHFGRLFKQQTGLSLYQFVIRRRIDRARYLLDQTSTPITEIAYECGFGDQVHLTRTFRRIVGTTPSAYRKEKQK